MSHLQLLGRLQDLDRQGYGSLKLEKMYDVCVLARKAMADNIRRNRAFSSRPDNKARKTCMTRPIIVSATTSRTVKVGKSGIVARSSRWAAPLSDTSYRLVPLSCHKSFKRYSWDYRCKAVKLGRIEKVWHMWHHVRPIITAGDCRYLARYRKMEFTSDSPRIARDRLMCDRLSVEQLIRFNARNVRK
jgi:hypothetical protein